MSLTIQETLKKDITRSIDGVIKANDESHLLQEVEEFVITKDIDRDLRRFAESYLLSMQKGQGFPFNGVWISGYFGSGKSHLLKILSLILSDRSVNGTRLRDIFLAKINDAFFKADLEKIFAVPATSVLFNIEQMAEGASAQASDTILFAFYRVFNKMRGYYDESGPLANFERDLDEEGTLQLFKDFFQQRNGDSWESVRSKSLYLKRPLFVSTVAEFRKTTDSDADKIISNYENNYSVSVEGFCREVAAWLKRQPDKNHRINFFVDEVGQFIADKSNHMLSLQTIVESLGVATQERAWVFVTSQEAIDQIVGNTQMRKGSDFSKIIARFKFRIALSSADVREVIQRRLLEKNETGTEVLRDFYHRTKESMRTVFSFREEGRNIHFNSEEAFIFSYPFPAYQYDLLQNALQGLGEHNAFVGQHVSRGERSMLEMFQDVAKAYRERELFLFAPFDAMYAGIRATLNTGLIRAINQAENNLDDELSKRVLKALLLVKYVDSFKATPENLRILLTESLDDNSVLFDARLHESLAHLEREMYIRRTGNVYEYLTNDEKDAEEEIRNISVDTAQYRKYLSDFLFGEIIRSTRITYKGHGHDYSFQRAVDDESPKGKGDLAIRLITPWHPDAGERDRILARAMGRKELAVIITEDADFVQELTTYFQTESWLKRIDPESAKYARIIGDKRAHNAQRLTQIRERLRQLFVTAEFAVGDQEILVTGATPIDRIERAFQELVSTFYPNLRMLKENFSQESLKKILYQESGFFTQDEAQRSEPEREMLNWIMRRIAVSQSVNLANIEDEFSSGTYGWYEWAVLCVLARLFAHQEIELFRATEILGRDEVYTILNQNRAHETVSIKPAPKISARDVERLKSLHFELFHTENQGSNSKESGIKFKESLLELSNKFSEALRIAPHFTFVTQLKSEVDKLNQLLKKSGTISSKTTTSIHPTSVGPSMKSSTPP